MSGNRRDSTSNRPVGEEPPYLSVGTEVSAKYRGAFCEANIKSVKKMVKCKVTFDKGSGSSTVTDDCIRGTLKVGSDVEVKLPDGQDVTGTLVKITDSSTYTVVFDDGDERTLKRTSLCLKGEKHFNESETLDHLPLTDPENFGTPVMQQGKKSRKGRRPSTSFDGEDGKDTDEIPARKKLLRSEEDGDKVVMVDVTEKKKTFCLPALQVSSTDPHCSELKSPENVLVRSFRDGKYLEVHPKDVKEFSKNTVITSNLPKGEIIPVKLAVENAVKYLETKQLPSGWNNEGSKPTETLGNTDSPCSSDEDSEDDEKERGEFMASLTKFLEEKGTPLVRSPVLGHRDLDLYKLFKIVSQMNGMDKIKSWQSVYLKMDIPVVTTTASYHIKNAYKRYLFDYEQHQREKEKKLLGEGKKCTKSEKSTKHARNSSVNAAGKSKDEIQSKSDSDKDSKELNPSDHNKLLTHGKPSRGGKAKNKGEITKAKAERIKSLKTPNSPKLHPKSPCSPKSLSSVGASGSTGCPSPSENVCDSSEVRTKTEQAACCDMTKDDKNVRKATDLMDMKEDDSNKEEVKDQNGTAKNVKNTLSDVTKKETKEKAFRNDRRSTKDIESSNKDKNEEEKRRNDKMEVMMDDVKKEDVEEEEEEKMKEESGAEMEDAVDVVNSPSGASDSVDGDEEYVKRADKKSAGQAEDKSEVSGELGGKQDGCIDVDGLEYKLNDRIDVRYGRGRNATVYQAKITSVDPGADEGLHYLVHYAGWNARHDEWIRAERIIGKGQKQTRTRTNKEPVKNNKPTPKPTVKPTPKPIAKKNGKNGAADKQANRSAAVKGRKRTPSPTVNVVPSRNSNGRTSKSRSDKTTVDSLDLADVKCQPRVTRQNSLPIVAASDSDCAGLKSQDVKAECEKDLKTSPRRASPSAAQTSPKSELDKNSDSVSDNDEEVLSKVGGGPSPVAEPKAKSLETEYEKAIINGEFSLKVVLETTLKRPHSGRSDESPPAKRKHEESTVSEVVFDEKKSPDCVKLSNDPASPGVETAMDETNTPDLTCSEQLPTNCVSPDPYTNEYPRNDRFFGNGVGGEQNGSELKEKDCSSSFDEVKPEKPTNRKNKGRRERKTRVPSSQSSFEGSECLNGPSNGTSVTLIPSPTRAPKYNFTEGLEDLLKKKEESSERIRLLLEKIKDIRKIYGELKSEVANIDRKRKRRQKRKREEELSAEEGNTRSPSRSSPLSTSNANTVSASNTLAASDCR